jgi:hypothetical protein
MAKANPVKVDELYAAAMKAECDTRGNDIWQTTSIGILGWH